MKPVGKNTIILLKKRSKDLGILVIKLLQESIAQIVQIVFHPMEFKMFGL